MYYKLKIGLIRAQELFIRRRRFSWRVGGLLYLQYAIWVVIRVAYTIAYINKKLATAQTVIFCIIWRNLAELNQ